MYWTNFWQSTVHVQQNTFGKTLIEVCSPHLYASFDTSWTQISSLFESQWVFEVCLKIGKSLSSKENVVETSQISWIMPWTALDPNLWQLINKRKCFIEQEPPSTRKMLFSISQTCNNSRQVWMFFFLNISLHDCCRSTYNHPGVMQ